MSAVNDFVSELVRAANDVEKLGAYEIDRLLERSVTTIRDMRQSIGIRRSNTAADAVIDLQIVQARARGGDINQDQVKAALLDAASMIRDLHIVLDTGTEIEIGNGGGNGGTDRW